MTKKKEETIDVTVKRRQVVPTEEVIECPKCQVDMVCISQLVAPRQGQNQYQHACPQCGLSVYLPAAYPRYVFVEQGEPEEA